MKSCCDGLFRSLDAACDVALMADCDILSGGAIETVRRLCCAFKKDSLETSKSSAAMNF